MKFVALALVVALASATSCTQKGWSYCKTSAKCGAGLGDCDNHNECKPGLSCVSSKAGYSLAAWPVDCCQCPSTTGNGGWHSCSANCQCSEKQGDCDNNGQCKSGLVCRSSGLGQTLPQSAKDYCCKKSGDWSACTTGNCRCQNGEGDCDSDSQCLPGLKCLSGKGGQAISGSAKDVCTKVINKGWSGCSNSKKCGHGEGDCDRNSHCKAGHECVSTVNGQALSGSAIDVCVKKVLSTTEDSMSAEADSLEMDGAEVATDESELEAEPAEDAAEAATEGEAEIEGDVVEQQEDELEE